MTREQKQKIAELRVSGFNYAAIGEMLGISKETVKTYCRRNQIAASSVQRGSDTALCRWCGKPIVQPEKQKRRFFCSKECREKWWHAHPDRLNKKAVYTFVCAGCGKPFNAYGNKNRKYCSHACYITARFKGGASLD